METPLYWQQLTKASMGTGQPNVNGQALSNLLLPLPPLNEQYQIVSKINNIFSHSEKLNF
jgi:restriction endonuclease S subunit